jgi:hypothetical protein
MKKVISNYGLEIGDKVRMRWNSFPGVSRGTDGQWVEVIGFGNKRVKVTVNNSIFTITDEQISKVNRDGKIYDMGELRRAEKKYEVVE